jgi:flagellar biosynthesis activator protein FlaF
MAPPAQRYARIPAPGNPAKTEAWALLESARLMEGAKTKDKAELLDALRRNWRLWTIFQANLVDAECTVPNEVRSNLLGLANFIDRHTAQLLGNPDPAKVDVLVNINRQIGEGLLEGQRAAAAKAASAPPPAAQLRETV